MAESSLLNSCFGRLVHHFFQRNTGRTVLLPILAALALHACGDVNNVDSTSALPPAPLGPLTILTNSPLPPGTTAVPYDVTLAAAGGAPPYTWSVVPGSPTLPDGFTLTPSTGNISGTPTATGTRLPEFKLTDSNTQSVQKVLSITINIAPTPLVILTTTLPSGSINQPYAVALSPTGGTPPYTWGLKAGTPPLPSGLDLSSNGVISGTPRVTNTATHTFTLTDAISRTVEKAMSLSIRAIPLSITTTSLPQGTANQRYSETLEAAGGTGAYTWRLASNSPALPMGLILNTSTGEMSGIPIGTTNQTYTFAVTDQTPPTPQTTTKTLQLIIGSATPNLIITTASPLPSGTVTQSYRSVTLASTGGTGTKTWDISRGALPVGLALDSSGVISGTPTTPGTSSPTVRVRDSGNPQNTATKSLSITINFPAPPTITTTSLPPGSFNGAYNHTVSVTGGIGTLIWGVSSGALPPGLSLNPSKGNISGTATSTGSFRFTLRVTDSIPQFDEQTFTLSINAPAPPEIHAFTLLTGTVNQPYPNTQLMATGGTLPYTWTVTPALAGGTLTLDPSSGVISGTPTSGQVTTHTFRVTDSTQPTHLFDEVTRTLTIIANVTPVTITTSSLPSGLVGQAYSGQLAATGGTPGYTFSLNNGSALPAGLSLSATGAITGTPHSSGTFSMTFRVQDSTTPTQQSGVRALSITISSERSPLMVTTRSLSDGRRNQPYADRLEASGGDLPYTWSASPPLPPGLTLAPTGEISGTPTTTSNIRHDFTVRDSTNKTDTRELRLRIRNSDNDD